MDDFVKHLHIGQCYDVRHWVGFIVCFNQQLRMNSFGNRCHTEEVLQYLLKENIISKENPCGLFIDQAVLEENIRELKEAFPQPYFHHHYAVKANPIKTILQVVKKNGLGVECASYGEVYLLRL